MQKLLLNLHKLHYILCIMKELNAFWILDLETTGLDTRKCSILSLTMLLVKNREIVKTIDMRTDIACPRDHISYAALKETGNCTQRELLEFFKMVNADKHPIVGWGLFYEIGVFKHKGIRFNKNYLDLMVTFRKLLKLKRNPKLSDICKRYKINTTEELHTSLGDTLRTFKLLQLLWERR